MKKTRKFYTASTLTSYNELLAAILNNGIAADIKTRRKYLAVTVTINQDDEQAMKELADATKDLEVCVAEEGEVFMFTDDIEMAEEVTRAKETCENAMAEMNSLRTDLNKSTESRNMYRRLYERSITDNIRIKNQIQAITTLLAGIYPDKYPLRSQTITDGAQE